MPRLTCTKNYSEIPIAHRAPFHDGHCAFIHGHNWSFSFTFEAKALDKNGFVMDFGKLKALKNRLTELDHACLIAQDDPKRALLDKMASEGLLRLAIAKQGTSSESIAWDLLRVANEIVSVAENGRVICTKVTVYEDQNNSATAIYK